MNSAPSGFYSELNFFLSRISSVRKMLVNQRRFICIGILFCGLLCGISRADTYKLTDGTTLTQNPSQKINFLGVSYYYKFQ